MSQQFVECMQCTKVPDNYLSLNCQHSFCLVCMAQNFLRGGRIYQKDQSRSLMYICSICEQETELDEGSVSAIDIILHQILIPCLDQVAQPKVIPEEEEPSQIQELTNPVDSILPPQSENNTCEKHQHEEMNLFCFSCEEKCFCVKCLVQFSQHKNHDVQNVQISMGKLKSKMNEANHTIQASIELMNLQKKRITDQSTTNLNQIEDFKRLFQSSFDAIIRQIKVKERDLMTQMTSLASIQQQQASNLLSDINIKINTLENLKNDFEKISNQKSYHMQCSSLIFNYYADCKQIMQKVVGGINFGELLYSSGPELQIKYFPDYKEQFFNISEFDERVHGIKERIDALNEKNLRPDNASQLFRSFSLHERNWVQPTAASSVSKRCTTQADEDFKFKSQVSLRVTGQLSQKTPDSSYYENSFQKKKQPTTNQKSLLDDFKSLYSDRLQSGNKEEKTKSQFIVNVKRSISELSPKQQISPYFKLTQRSNPLNVLRYQQGQFYKSRLLEK